MDLVLARLASLDFKDRETMFSPTLDVHRRRAKACTV
jgi:hypothetical protein